MADDGVAQATDADASTGWQRLAQEIRSSRENLGLTQEELAEFSGLSRSTVRNAEYGKPNLSEPVLRTLSRSFGYGGRFFLRQGPDGAFDLGGAGSRVLSTEAIRGLIAAWRNMRHLPKGDRDQWLVDYHQLLLDLADDPPRLPSRFASFIQTTARFAPPESLAPFTFDLVALVPEAQSFFAHPGSRLAIEIDALERDLGHAQELVLALKDRAYSGRKALAELTGNLDRAGSARAAELQQMVADSERSLAEAENHQAAVMHRLEQARRHLASHKATPSQGQVNLTLDLATDATGTAPILTKGSGLGRGLGRLIPSAPPAPAVAEMRIIMESDLPDPTKQKLIDWATARRAELEETLQRELRATIDSLLSGTASSQIAMIRRITQMRGALTLRKHGSGYRVKQVERILVDVIRAIVDGEVEKFDRDYLNPHGPKGLELEEHGYFEADVDAMFKEIRVMLDEVTSST